MYTYMYIYIYICIYMYKHINCVALELKHRHRAVHQHQPTKMHPTEVLNKSKLRIHDIYLQFIVYQTRLLSRQ